MMTKYRRSVLIFGSIFGAIGIVVGGSFAVAGAGTYGTPFQGGPYFNSTLILILVFGPLAILPSVIFDLWKPGWGGLLLCICTPISVAMIILNNISEFGFNVYNAMTASSCLSLPIFVVGSMLYFSGRSNRSWEIRIWQTMIALLVLVFLFFAIEIGPDYGFMVQGPVDRNSNPPELEN